VSRIHRRSGRDVTLVLQTAFLRPRERANALALRIGAARAYLTTHTRTRTQTLSLSLAPARRQESRATLVPAGDRRRLHCDLVSRTKETRTCARARVRPDGCTCVTARAAADMSATTAHARANGEPRFSTSRNILAKFLSFLANSTYTRIHGRLRCLHARARSLIGKRSDRRDFGRAMFTRNGAIRCGARCAAGDAPWRHYWNFSISRREHTGANEFAGTSFQSPLRIISAPSSARR